MIPIQSLVMETTEFSNTKVNMPIYIKTIMAQLNTLLKKIVIMIQFTTSLRASLSTPGLWITPTSTSSTDTAPLTTTNFHLPKLSVSKKRRVPRRLNHSRPFPKRPKRYQKHLSVMLGRRPQSMENHPLPVNSRAFSWTRANSHPSIASSRTWRNLNNPATSQTLSALSLTKVSLTLNLKMKLINSSFMLTLTRTASSHPKK